jgi:hypothetical protein
MRRHHKLRKRYGRASGTTRVIEGVTYRPYTVTFKTDAGKRVRWTHWSAGPPWIGGEVARYLDDRDDVTKGQPVVIAHKGW